MPIDIAKIQEIARSSLMPDFFAVRIDEEGLFDGLKQLIARIKVPAQLPQLEQIKRIGAAASTATEFIEAIKRENLFPTLRDVISKLHVA